MDLQNRNPDDVNSALDSQRAGPKVMPGSHHLSKLRGQQLPSRSQDLAKEDSLGECPECGHMNPVADRFCGMCGMEREAGVDPLIMASQGDQLPAASAVRLQQHHHHYHHFTIRHEPHIVIAVALLLIAIALQQWQAYRRQKLAEPLPVPRPAAEETAKGRQDVAANRAPDTPPLQNNAKTTEQREPVEHRKVLREQEAETAQRTSLVRSSDLEPPDLSRLNLQYSALPSVVPPSNRAPNVAEAAKKSARRRSVILGGVSEERLVEKVVPQYPEAAAQAGLEGEVVVDAIIGKNGTIKELRQISGSPVLGGAAMDAIRKWKYRPYFVNSEPVEIWTRITIRFGK